MPDSPHNPDSKLSPELAEDELSTTLETHNLTEQEYERIITGLGRAPNLNELGLFSVMWSEHCSYKSSRVHLKRLPTEGPRLLQGPGENAGVVDIGHGLAAVFKVESHNHPSFIEPFQGAATGVGGIIRDIFTMGARPVALMNSLRFGPLDDSKGSGQSLQSKTRAIVSGVVSGIASYGNSMGIPTVAGEIAFEDCYRLNPLVNAFCLGIAPVDRIFLAKAEGEMNPVFYVGAKTGKDGIHGATMASAEFDEATDDKRPTVQVGDPFMEKLLLEACLELMATDALVAIQDMGAAGLTCSSAEMGARGGMGIEIDLVDVPQREREMTPYEIMLSESQERMLLIAKAGREAEVETIFEKWDLEAAAIGRVTGDGLLRVLHEGRLVALVPAGLLVDEGPVYERPMKRAAALDRLPLIKARDLETQGNLEQHWLDLVGSPGIASRHWVYEQYDHMVQSNTIVLPGSDAGVVRIKGTPMALAMKLDGNARFTSLDPRLGAKIAVAEACRNLAATGAHPIGVTNCMNFGNPEKAEVMHQFSEVVDGMREACLHWDIPVTGGNVSFYNETDGQGILPTPVIGVVGVISDQSRHLSHAFKADGEIIFLLGTSREELGGSEYLKLVTGRLDGIPPQLDMGVERALHGVVLEAAEKSLLSSAHDLSEGGLAVALTECLFSFLGAGVGASVELESDLPVEALLFSESQSRMLVSVRKEKNDAFRALVETRAVPYARIGTTGGDRLRVSVNGETAIEMSLEQIHDRWWHSLERELKN